MKDLISFEVKSKAYFFDRAIAKSLKPSVRKFLGLTGAATRRAARRLIRRARQKRISELTPEELRKYRAAQEAYRDGRLKTKPRRPEVSANKGEPPRTHSSPSPLRDGNTGILFALDQSLQSVVIGPLQFNAKPGYWRGRESRNFGAEWLEENNPFMRPALDQIEPQLPEFLRRTAI